MEKPLYNNLIRNLSITIKDAIDESIGTIQLQDNLANKLKIIITDIKNHNYYKFPIFYKDYNDILQLKNEHNLYSLKYQNIEWIQNLEIIICEKPGQYSTEAAALIDNENRTIYGKNNILYATIIINNPDHIRFLETHLYHELRHYYDNLKHIDYISKYDNNDLNYYNEHAKFNINFLKDKNTILKYVKYPSSILWAKKTFIEQLYWLNNQEINAHNEDIFGEIYDFYKNSNSNIEEDLIDISDTYKCYKNIYEIFKFYQLNLDEETTEYIRKNMAPDFYYIYFNKINKKPQNINFIYKKIFKKLNKIFKHSKQMQLYCKKLFQHNER